MLRRGQPCGRPRLPQECSSIFWNVPDVGRRRKPGNGGGSDPDVGNGRKPLAGVCCKGPDTGVSGKGPDAGNGRVPVEPVTILAGVRCWCWGSGCVLGRSIPGFGVIGLSIGITLWLLMRRATSRRLISINSLHDAGTIKGVPLAARSSATLSSPSERTRRCI